MKGTRTRKLRRAVDVGLPIAGVVLVLGAVVFFYDLYVQLALVAIGLFLIEAGIWQLANPLLPSQRRHAALRAEVDGFIGLVRRLNTAALERQGPAGAEAARDFESLREEMHASVERMVEYAGKPGKSAAPSPRTLA